jgi:hypothetical protein
MTEGDCVRHSGLLGREQSGGGLSYYIVQEYWQDCDQSH